MQSISNGAKVTCHPTVGFPEAGSYESVDTVCHMAYTNTLMYLRMCVYSTNIAFWSLKHLVTMACIFFAQIEVEESMF